MATDDELRIAKAEAWDEALKRADDEMRSEFDGKPAPGGVEAIGRADRAVRRIRVRNPYRTTECSRCLGCGLIAEGDDDGAPWSFWAALKPPANMAVVLGLVRPSTCPQCGGVGTVP